MNNQLRALRVTQGRTLADVAAKAGMSHVQLSRLETGERQLKDFQITALARALGVQPAEILGPKIDVPVVGYVGAGAAVEMVDAYPTGGGLTEVPCPLGLNPSTTVAVIVRGDSQAPMINDGWIIFYSRDPEPDTTAVMGKLCIVKIADGPVMLKRIRRGPATSRFNLESANAPLIEDVKLEWAAPVRAMLPPDTAGHAVRERREELRNLREGLRDFAALLDSDAEITRQQARQTLAKMGLNWTSGEDVEVSEDAPRSTAIAFELRKIAQETTKKKKSAKKVKRP